MGKAIEIAGRRVADLLEYRAARAAEERPLFTSEAGEGQIQEQAPEKPLLPRQIAHRERMLLHLTSAR